MGDAHDPFSGVARILTIGRPDRRADRRADRITVPGAGPNRDKHPLGRQS
jgi:hypothetical protein